MNQLLRAGLFIYECFRLLWVMGPGGQFGIPALAVYAAPSALFPLMALFFWLDSSRYGVYVPLYMAGKIISICAAVGWLIFFRLNIMNIELSFGVVQLEIMLCGDIFSVAAASFINKRPGGE
jgi:hypothetical protein